MIDLFFYDGGCAKIGNEDEDEDEEEEKERKRGMMRWKGRNETIRLFCRI